MTIIESRINAALVGSLYAEALILADEARSWFDHVLVNRDQEAASNLPVDAAAGADGDDALFRWAGFHDPSLRIALSCESLRITTRLMHIIAWLLLQRAIMAGELPADAAYRPTNRLGESPASDTATLGRLPPRAQELAAASERLHARVAQLDAAQSQSPVQIDPVGAMLSRLEQAL